MSSFISRNPFTQKLIQEVPYASKDSLNSTISRLHENFLSRRKPGGIDRSFLKHDLEKLGGNIVSKKEQIAQIITAETGKPISGAKGEVEKACGHIKYYCDNIGQLTGTRTVESAGGHKNGYFLDPLGVIWKVVPFNFPFWTPLKMMIPALVAGNAILVRPSQTAPLTGMALLEVFRQSGFDNVDIAFSSPEHSDSILGNPHIQGLSFTGSTQVGRILGEMAGKHLKRAALELGGNDAFVVFKDADIQKSVKMAIKTRLNNNGQVCNAGKRFLIAEEVFDEFVNTLDAEVSALKIGDPLDEDTVVSCLAKDGAKDDLWSQVNRALAGGDTILFGGEAPSADDPDYSPNYFPVTGIKVNDPFKSVCFSEELFGPVFPLWSFKGEEDLLKVINASEYGLGCTLIGEDIEKLESLIPLIDTGAVFINQPVGSNSRLPSGGVKASGYGRDSGYHGVEGFSNVKTFDTKK